MTQRNTKDTMGFLRGQHDSGSTAWYEQCLKLQRTARNLDGLYPSAYAAMEATPTDHRFDLKDAKRGMVAFFDNPHDNNPYGHIVGISGHDHDGNLLCWTNDVAGHGRVSMVKHTFFLSYWGAPFVFAADHLNGVDLSMPEDHVTPPAPAVHPRELLQDAVDTLTLLINHNRKMNHPVKVKALTRDRQHILDTLKHQYGVK